MLVMIVQIKWNSKCYKVLPEVEELYLRGRPDWDIRNQNSEASSVATQGWTWALQNGNHMGKLQCNFTKIEIHAQGRIPLSTKMCL